MDTKALIENYCKTLRLGDYIPENYQAISAKTHSDFLIALLAGAKAEKEEKRQIRYVNAAGFELRKYLSDFDFSQIKLPEEMHKAYLCECKVFEQKDNLILYGAPGTGKTHLAIALGTEACMRGQKVLYYKTAQLVRLMSNDNKTLESFMRKLKKADVLILDEWGYIPFDRKGTQLLFEAISSCYEKKSIVITTNLPFDEWNTIFCDQKLTVAILDRVVHHGHLVMHHGESYRLKHSCMN